MWQILCKPNWRTFTLQECCGTFVCYYLISRRRSCNGTQYPNCALSLNEVLGPAWAYLAWAGSVITRTWPYYSVHLSFLVLRLNDIPVTSEIYRTFPFAPSKWFLTIFGMKTDYKTPNFQWWYGCSIWKNVLYRTPPVLCKINVLC